MLLGTRIRRVTLLAAAVSTAMAFPAIADDDDGDRYPRAVRAVATRSFTTTTRRLVAIRRHTSTRSARGTDCYWKQPIQRRRKLY